MSVSRRSLTLVGLLAAGAAPLLLTLSLQSRPAPAPQIVFDPHSPRHVADQLDAIIQPRFQDDRAGVFGTGRIVPMVRGHIAVNGFQPATPTETFLWKQVVGERRPYHVGFLHCAHVPGKYEGSPLLTPFPAATPLPRFVTPKPYVSELLWHSFPSAAPNWNDPKVRSQREAEEQSLGNLLQQAAVEAMPALLKGQGQEKTVHGWLIVTRPVRASKDSCLTCHVGAHRGDTLGAMVYAVGDAAAGG